MSPVIHAADLDTLPIGAVVLDRNGIAYQRLRNGRWCRVGSDSEWLGRFMWQAGPFTLIHHPLDTDATERTEP